MGLGGAVLSLAKIFGFEGGEHEPPANPTRFVRQAVALCHKLLSTSGEVTSLKLSAEALDLVRGFDAEARSAFVDYLASEFSADTNALRKAAKAYYNDPSPKNLLELQESGESPRMELFRRLNVAPGATQVLVALRGHILEDVARKPAWHPVEEDLRSLFLSWFNRGFLNLQRIDWRSSAAVLEKLIQYEAVHEIRGFEDLRRRLAADRRIYVFFHQAMPDEPVVFVEIALVRGTSSRIGPLLDPKAELLDPDLVDTAIFYSITNCQAGLRGVPLGSFLIKQVVDELRQTVPRLRRFVTLSPVPGFRAWLKGQPEWDSLKERMADSTWMEDKTLEPILTSLCAQYLIKAKKGKEPMDSVARFHLRNGASLERINWMADLSERGLLNSFGMMVNYAYRPREIEFNHERYADKFKVAAESKVEALVKKR